MLEIWIKRLLLLRSRRRLIGTIRLTWCLHGRLRSSIVSLGVGTVIVHRLRGDDGRHRPYLSGSTVMRVVGWGRSASVTRWTCTLSIRIRLTYLMRKGWLRLTAVVCTRGWWKGGRLSRRPVLLLTSHLRRCGTRRIAVHVVLSYIAILDTAVDRLGGVTRLTSRIGIETETSQCHLQQRFLLVDSVIDRWSK